MKKLAVMVVAAMFALALVGCVSGGAGSSASASSASGSAESSASSASAGSAQTGGASSASASADAASSASGAAGIANPWTEVATAGEAGQGAGFATGFSVDDNPKVGDLTWREVTYSYMEGIAQASFDGGAVELTVRKGQGVSGRDFTGDYNEYAHTWTQVVDGVEVSCSGQEEGASNLAEWSSDGYSYAIYCTGLGGENYGVSDSDLPGLIVAVK